MTSSSSIDVKRLYVFVRDATFCERSDAVLGFVQQSFASNARAQQSEAVVLLCAETHAHTAPVLLLRPSDEANIDALSDGTVRVDRVGGDDDDDVGAVESASLRMRADSELVLLHASYRVVFSLDVSPSVSSIDSESNEVLFDTLLRALDRAAFAMLDVFRIESAGRFVLEYRPRLFVSIVAQMGLPDTFWPIVHCALLTERTVAGTLITVRRRMQRTESRAAMCAPRVIRRGVAGADVSAVVRNSVFVLKLMPPHARPLLVLITDGAVSLPDTTAYDNLLMLLNREGVTCSSFQVGSGFAPSSAFGFVSDSDVLRRLAVATHGCFFMSLRLASVCNDQSHQALRQFSQRFSSHQGREMDVGDVQDTRESANPAPGNLLQQKLMWNPFSPARRYFAYSDAYRRNGDGSGSQLDGPLLATLPVHAPYFESRALLRTATPTKPPRASDYVSFSKSRVFVPTEEKGESVVDSTRRSSSLTLSSFGTAVVDAEVVVPSAAGLHRLLAVNHPFPWCDPPPPVPLMRESLRVYELNVSAAVVADVRLREGFLVDDMERANRLTLLLPWIANVVIGYNVTAKKDADVNSPPVRVELSVYACDEFLNEFAYLRANQHTLTPMTTHVHKLHAFVAELLQTDRLLQVLHTRIVAAPASNEQPAQTIVTPKHKRRQARLLWQTLSMLAAHSMHRWLRVEELEMTLSSSCGDLHPADYSPFGQRVNRSSAAELASLSVPLVDSRSSGKPEALIVDVSVLRVDYQRASDALQQHCSRWATYVHSNKLFVRFVTADGAPVAESKSVAELQSQRQQAFPSRSFCMLRLIVEGEAVGVVRAQFAMYGVTPAGRRRVLADFERELSAAVSDDMDEIGATIVAGERDRIVVALEPLRVPVVGCSRRPSCSLLVRYARSVAPQSLVVSNLHSLATLHPTVPLLESLMHWRRRIWRIRDPYSRALLVDALVHERMRDGMQLRGAGGVFTLVRVLSMAVDRSSPTATLPSLLQYVVYAVAPDLVVTELWLEPQHGALLGGSATARRAAGVHLFNDIDAALHNADRELVWALVTFDIVMLTIQSGHLSRAEQAAFLEHQTSSVSSAAQGSLNGLVLEPTPVSLGALVRCAARYVVEYPSISRVQRAIAEVEETPSTALLRHLIERHESGELHDVATTPSTSLAALDRAKSAAVGVKSMAAVKLSAGKRGAKSMMKSPARTISTEAVKAPVLDPTNWPIKMLRAAMYRQLCQSSAASNMMLWGAFGQFIAYASDCEIPQRSIGSPTNELAALEGARCFAKRVGGTTVMIAFLARVVDTELDAKTAVGIPLRLHAFECARDQLVVSHVLTPPHVPYMRTGAGANISSAVPPNQFSAEGELFLRNLAAGFERCFARAVFTQLRRGALVSADDAARALSVCRPFSTEVDITQYLRVQRKHFIGLQRIAARGARVAVPAEPTAHADGFSRHEDDDDDDELVVNRSADAKAGLSRLGSGSQQRRVCADDGSVDDATRMRIAKRAETTRDQFRAAVLEHFRPLSDFVVPTASIPEIGLFADLWVYSPSEEKRREQRSQSQASGGTAAPSADEDDVTSARGAATTSTTTPVTTIGGAQTSAPTAPPTAPPLKSKASGSSAVDTNDANVGATVVDGDWAADVNDGSSDGPDVAALHIDKQTASGAWPMPLFLRIERVLQIVKRSPVRTPVRDIPTPIDDAVDGTRYDRVSLRFVVLTLPPYESLMPETVAATDDGEAAEKAWTELPVTMQVALKSFTSSVDAFLSSQVLDVLRFRRPMSAATMALVEYHMSRIGRRLTEFVVPLHFISPADGLAMFPAQLTSTFFLSLRKFGEAYCVVEVRDRSGSGSASTSSADASMQNPATPPLNESARSRNASYDSWLQRNQRLPTVSPPLLGVSSRAPLQMPFSPLSMVVASQPSASPPSPVDEEVIHIPFWLLIRVAEQEVRFSFVAPDTLSGVERSRFCTDLRAGARRVCERVNQLYLLTQLHETRTSSELQILSVDKRERKANRQREQAAAVEGADVAQVSVASSGDKRHVFFPGQFVCPQVYAIHLPLHPRLMPDVAMRALVEAALHPFSVTNRKNVFVYREQTGCVFYLQLAESDVQRVRRTRTTASAAPSRPDTPEAQVADEAGAASLVESHRRSMSTADLFNLSSGSMPTHESDDDSDSDGEGGDGYATPSLLSASATGVTDAEAPAVRHSLVLRVFGIDQPTAEIQSQMRELLEHKLSEITLKLMSTQLARNPNLRLTIDDVNFLRSVDVSRKAVDATAIESMARVPCRLRIGVPAAVGSVGLWMPFLRWYLLQRQFLTSANVPRSAFDATRRRSDVAPPAGGEPLRRTLTPTTTDASTMSLQPHTQPLLFNHVLAPGTRPSGRMRQYGDGIALLWLRVRDDSDQLVARYVLSERDQRCAMNSIDSELPLSTAELRAAVTGVLEQVRVEVEFDAHAMLDDTGEEANGPAHRCSSSCDMHWLCVDIWQRGHVHIEELARGLVEQVRHGLIAFVLEVHLVAPRLRKDTRFWMSAVERLTARATETACDAFADVDTPLALSSHAVVPFARDVAIRLTDIVGQLQASVFYRPLEPWSGDDDEQLLVPLGSGMPAMSWCDVKELPRLLVTTALATDRSGNVAHSDDQQHFKFSKRSSMDDPASMLTQSLMMRRPFVIACVSRERVRIVTYNWKSERVSALRDAINALMHWSMRRHAALDSILLQKLGLTQVLRSELLTDSFDDGAMVPSIEPLLFNSAPPAASVTGSAVSTPDTSNVMAQVAVDGDDKAVIAAAIDEKKAGADNSQTINDLIAIGGNVVRRVSSRHDMVAAAMAARRRGLAFGPARGASAVGRAGDAAPSDASGSGGSGATSTPSSLLPATAGGLGQSQVVGADRSGVAALSFHDLLLRDELLGVAVPPMGLSALVDPVQRHGAQFAKLAAMVAQRRDVRREVMRALSRLSRVGHGDRLSRGDLQRLVRFGRRLECTTVSTPSAPLHTSNAARPSSNSVRDTFVAPAAQSNSEATVASWNDAVRLNPASDELTLMLELVSPPLVESSVGWSATQANRIADCVTQLLTDRHGLRVLTLTTKTVGETTMGVANVANERWLARPFGRRAAFLAHMAWTASAVGVHTYVVDAIFHLPTRRPNAEAERERALMGDETAQIQMQSFLRATVWDFSVNEMRDLIDRRQPCLPATEFTRLLQQHVDAASLRASARVLSAADGGAPLVVWSSDTRMRGAAQPIGARSFVIARLSTAAVDGDVSALDLLAFLARRADDYATHVRSLDQCGIANVIALNDAFLQETIAQLPSTHEFRVIVLMAVTPAVAGGASGAPLPRLTLVLLCTPRSIVELGPGVDLSSARLGVARREMTVHEACLQCLADAQVKLSSLLTAAAADFRRDRLWRLMTEPQRRATTTTQAPGLTLGDFTSVTKALVAVDLALPNGVSLSLPTQQPRSLSRLAGHELVDTMLRSRAMRPWRDVMQLAATRFGTVRKDGTVRRATIFLSDEMQPQLVVCDTAIPKSLLLLSAGAATVPGARASSTSGEADLAGALAAQWTVIDGARLYLCRCDASATTILSELERQLANDFVQFLLACMWLRLASQPLDPERH